jgi:hypothetical protein
MTKRPPRHPNGRSHGQSARIRGIQPMIHMTSMVLPSAIPRETELFA